MATFSINLIFRNKIKRRRLFAPPLATILTVALTVRTSAGAACILDCYAKEQEEHKMQMVSAGAACIFDCYAKGEEHKKQMVVHRWDKRRTIAVTAIAVHRTIARAIVPRLRFRWL